MLYQNLENVLAEITVTMLCNNNGVAGTINLNLLYLQEPILKAENDAAMHI